MGTCYNQLFVCFLQAIAVDHVILCSGQKSQNDLEQPLKDAGIIVHNIGASKRAKDMDGKIAIKEGAELASKL